MSRTRNRRQFLEDSNVCRGGSGGGRLAGQYAVCPRRTAEQKSERTAERGGRGNEGTGRQPYRGVRGRKDTVITYAVDVDSTIGNTGSTKSKKRQGSRPNGGGHSAGAGRQERRYRDGCHAEPLAFTAAIWAMQPARTCIARSR